MQDPSEMASLPQDNASSSSRCGLEQRGMKKALVFIIGYSFERPALGSDVSNIRKTFGKTFDAEIIEWIDFPLPDLTKRLSELSDDSWRNRFREVDFVTVFFLAHGFEEGNAYIITEKSFDIRNIRHLVMPYLFKIRELDCKLKWLVVQTCRGKLSEPTARDGRADIYSNYFFITYCTAPNQTSFQKAGTPGKVYITYLCEEIQENASKLSLAQILHNVHSKMRDFGQSMGKQEYPRPEYRTNCDFDYYFMRD